VSSQLPLVKLERNLRLIAELNAENQELLEQLAAESREDDTPCAKAEPRSSAAPAARLLSPKQAGSHANLSTKTIYRAIEQGKLPALRIGNRLRIDQADLDRWLEHARVSTDDGTKPTVTLATAPGQRRIRQLLDHHKQRTAV
jgi:excisionase family DNA binding protein